MSATANLNPLIDVCAALRQVHPEMTVSQLQVFTLIVTNPGISMAQIAERTGLMEGSVSRIVALLSQYGSRTAEGLALFQMEQDTNDRRFRTLATTSKGKALVAQLASLLSYGERNVRTA